MLQLLHPTPVDWVATAEQNLQNLLTDHAHCELKAAQSALSLIARYGVDAPQIVGPLTELVAEETEHFQRVYQAMTARGIPMSVPTSDDYVSRLRKVARVDHEQAPPLLDRLLICALIEARSCERFKLLSEHLTDETLRDFYFSLMASEARHFTLFTGLAEQIFGTEISRQRLKVLAQREAQIAHELPLGAEVHG